MKIAGSYGSLIKGVSQQAPEVRQEGQHAEQVNMMSDPVAGLTRRRGSIYKARQLVSGYAGQTITNALTTFGGYREIEHSTGGKDYVILMRDKASPQTYGNSLPPVMCYNRTDHVWLTVQWNGTTQPTFVTANGVSAAVSIGQYLLFAVNNLPCSTSSTAVYRMPANHKVTVQVRGGAYNRTYQVIMPGGASFSYTTPDAAVAGSASAILPANIAQQLYAAGSAAGFAQSGISGATFCLLANTLGEGIDVSCTDGGDGGLIRAVYDTVDSVDKLPVAAYNGQIIKVQTGPSTWFYVRAYNKGSFNFGETIWREAAGTQQGTSCYGLGRARIVGSTLYIGYSELITNPNGLTHMPTQPEAVPTLVASLCGDALTNIQPRWLSHQINYMAMFQDRLLVGSGAEVAVSGAGDYLNFYRSTMLTIPASDGFAMVAQGGEDDTVRTSVTYNKNLVIFGDKRQYLISGSVALAATAANMSLMTVYPDATECRPIAAGGQIYYARNREGSVNVHQIQPGQYVDSAESFPSSAQVNSYIPAPACTMESVPGAPALLVVRSRTVGNGLYILSYIDQPDGRKQNAWFRWEFDPKCGQLMGVKNTPDGLLLFWARYIEGYTSLFLVADLLPLGTSLSHMPYLDSMRPNDGLVGIGTSEAGYFLAFDNTTDRFMLGDDWALGRAGLMASYPTEAPSLWVGLPYDSYVVLTNPYQRDKDNHAILTGRTVVTRLRVSARESAGIEWEITSGGAVKDGAFNGRILGSPINKIGTVPVSDTIASIPIGRETRAYSIKLKASKWYPLNLIGIEWVGQVFNRTPRA